MQQANFMIPFQNFGGQGEVLHFAHANAYPPGCYQQLLKPFQKHFQVIAMHQRPLWPESEPERNTQRPDASPTAVRMRSNGFKTRMALKLEWL